MCGLCGVVDTDHNWPALPDGAGTSPWMRRQERARLAALATLVLQPVRIAVEDFEGVSFIVRSATGVTALASGLPEIWRVAEVMCGRRIDPFEMVRLPNPD